MDAVGKNKNQGWSKTEKAIIKALMGEEVVQETTGGKRRGVLPRVGELVRRAQISRSSFYRHHRTTPEIIVDYNQVIMRVYRRDIKRRVAVRQGTGMRGLYLGMMLFVLKNKLVFGILFKYEGAKVVEQMILLSKARIEQVCQLPRHSEKVMKIYAKEVAGVFEMWGRLEFAEKEAERVFHEIMYLTNTIGVRLGELGVKK